MKAIISRLFMVPAILTTLVLAGCGSSGQGGVSAAGTSKVSSSQVSLTAQALTVGTFTATGNMTTPRILDTATLLASGQVLVAGGTGDSSAELYDPATGIFTATGSMTYDRFGHSAVLLPNGKVLIAAGDGNDQFARNRITAELFEPATGIFTLTGNLAIGHTGQSGTLLPNGKVLIAGGGDGCSALSELYDPATGTFAATGNTLVARSAHTATLLSNGKVLIAGGVVHNASCISGNASTSAELYDPATGSFTSTGSMTTPRYEDTATLLPNGKVLIAGGQNSIFSNAILSSAELYDPASGTFSAAGSMSAERWGHTATLLPNGTVLVAGGGNVLGQQSSAELYDPATNSFTAISNMTAPRVYNTATLLADGAVLIAGGEFQSGTLAELYSNPTPAEQVSSLELLVNSFNLPGGTANSLDAKLNNVLADLTAGNTNTACNVLGAFTNEVSAQSGKKLTTAQANQLIAAALGIQSAAGCP